MCSFGLWFMVDAMIETMIETMLKELIWFLIEEGRMPGQKDFVRVFFPFWILQELDFNLKRFNREN